MLITLDIVANCNNDDIICDVIVDNTTIFSTSACTELQSIHYEISDDIGHHNVQISMKGKQYYHTVVDNQGNVQSDIFFEIKKLEFEEVNVREIFCLGKKCYTHSFNNPKAESFVDEFYGTIGCNGVVNIEFETPIYLWFLSYFS